MSKVKAKPIAPDLNQNIMSSEGLQGQQNPAYLLPKSDDSTGVVDNNLKDYSGYAEGITRGETNLDSQRAASQSGFEQAFRATKRAGGVILGGTIAGIGSLGALFTDLMTEGQRQEADFSNAIMELGDGIEKSVNKNNPIYRENPEQSFDFGDFGWWMENIPSVASSLSLLVPARGAVGLLGGLAKAAGIADKAGKTTKFLATIGTSALVSRNAENMRESMSVAEQTREELGKKLAGLEDGDFMSYLGTNEIGRKFLETGKEPTRENFTKFAGAQAGLESYSVNAKNIVFDLMQAGIAYKGLSGFSRSRNITNGWLGEGGVALAKAEAAALGKTLTTRQLIGAYAKSAAKSTLSGVSEGVEEIVNTIGTQEGLRIKDKALGTDTSPENLTDRVAKYLEDGHTWEAGFWGYFGGKVFEYGAGKLEKIVSPEGKGSGTNERLTEIAKREDYLKQIVEDHRSIEIAEESGAITKEQAAHAKGRLGESAAFSMGLNAAANGQTDNLMAMVQAPEFVGILTKGMSAEEQSKFGDEQAAQTVNNIMEQVKVAEKIYNRFATKIFNTDASSRVKQVLFADATGTAYDSFQKQKEAREAEVEYNKELSEEAFSAKRANPLYTTQLENESLGYLIEEYNKVIPKLKPQAAAMVAKRRDELVEKRDSLKEVLSTGKLEELDREDDALIGLLAKRIAADTQVSLNNERLDSLTKPATITKLESELEAIRQKDEDERTAAALTAIQEATAAKQVSEVDTSTVPETPAIQLALFENEKEVETLAVEEAKVESIPVVESPSERSILPANESTELASEIIEPEVAVTTQPTVNAESTIESVESDIEVPLPVLEDLAVAESPVIEQVMEAPVVEVVPAVIESTVIEGEIPLFVPVLTLGTDMVANDNGFSATEQAVEKIRLIQNLKAGDEVQLFIDDTNPYHKDTQEGAAIGVRVAGQVLFYLNSEASAAKRVTGEPLKQATRALELANLKRIRSAVWNNQNSPVTAKIAYKSPGVVIPGKLGNPLDVIAGTWKLGYTDPSAPVNNKIQIVGANKFVSAGTVDQYNRDGVYGWGMYYVMTEGLNFDGTDNSRVPLRLQYGKINAADQRKVADSINKIVEALRSGSKLNSEKIQVLIEQIGQVTPVNKFNQNINLVTGAVEGIPKPYFKVHNNRIEFVFNNGTQIATIWASDMQTKVSTLVIEEFNGRKPEFKDEAEFRSAKGKVLYRGPLATAASEQKLMEALSTKVPTINFEDLESGKITAEELFNSGKLKSDWGVLSNGNERLSNFWSAANSSLTEGTKRFQQGKFVITINNTTVGSEIALEPAMVAIPEPVVIEDNVVAEDTAVVETMNKIMATQAEIKQDGDRYIIKGKEYIRLSTAIGNSFEGDSSMYEDSRIAGNTVDRIVRDFFINGEAVQPATMSIPAFDALIDRLEKIQETIDARGEKFLTSNIVVFDEENGVAGEIDILSIQANGNLRIYDVKSSKKGTGDTSYTKKWSGNGLTRSKKDQHTLQQSGYKYMLEKMLGIEVEGLAIMPFRITYNKDGFIMSLAPEKGVQLTYNSEVEELLKTARARVPLPVRETPAVSIYDGLDDIQLEDEALPMLVQTDMVAEYPTEEERRANWGKMFGENVNFDSNVDELIRLKGELAWGTFSAAGAAIYRKAPKTVEYHEAFHAVTELYLTPSELTRLYGEASKIFGEHLTRRDLNERLAENFRLYAANRNLTKSSGFIREFFDKLIYAFKNFFGKATIKNLYRGIYSGHFNYQPTARVMEFTKTQAMPMLVNDLSAKFTQKEIEDYTNWATMIVAADIPFVEGKTNKEVIANSNQFNLRKRVLKRLAIASKAARDRGDTFVADNIDKVAENWGGNESGFWQKVIKNVQVKLNYTIAFDEEAVNEFEGNVQMQKDWDDRVSYSKSQRESFDFDLKRIIMTTPKLSSLVPEILEDGTLVYKDYEIGNAANLPVPIDFNTVYPMLALSMTNAVDKEEMMARLYNLAEVDPSLIHLWNRMQNNEALQAKWFTNFNKSFSKDQHIRFTPLENEGYAVRIDRANKPYRVADDWVNKIQSEIAITNVQTDSKTYKGNDVAWINSRSADASSYIQANDLENAIEAVAAYAKVLGMDLSAETLAKVINNKQIQEHENLTAIKLLDSLFTDLQWVGKRIVDGMTNNAPIYFQERGRLLRLAGYVGHYEPEAIDNSYFNTSGNTVFSITKPSYLSDFYDTIESLNNPMTVDKIKVKKMILDKIKSMLMDKSMQMSNWIYSTPGSMGMLKVRRGEKEIANLTIDDLNLPVLRELSLAKSGDVKDTFSGYGADFGSLSDSDWDLYTLNTYFGNLNKDRTSTDYPILIQSDSGNIWTIKSKRIPVVYESGKVQRNSKIYQAVMNTVYQETMRMEQASQLLFQRVSIRDGIFNLELKPVKLTKEQKDNLIIGYHYSKVAESDIYVNDELWYQKGDPITLTPEALLYKRKPTGRVFTFSNTNYYKNGELMSLDKIGELKLYGVFDRSVLKPETEEAIKAHIDAFIENLVQEDIKYYTGYKAIVEQSKIGNKSLIENWDGDFNLAIADMSLNTYINYIEQANFFTGVMPEYKSTADVNKRAKQTTSPKQPASTFFRGNSYKAVILKDAIVDSVYLEKMAAGLRQQLKSQFPALTSEQLDARVEKVVSRYKGINSADAQGYITLDRMEKILRDYGRWNDKYERLFTKARNPNLDLNAEELDLLLQVIKPFYYERGFDSMIGIVRSRQVKTSLLPLIPKFYKGTELEALVSEAEKQGVEEIYFESAVKVGRFKLSDVTKDGKLKPDFAANLVIGEFYNANWGIQLDVPEHLKDEENKLGVQIAKLAFANLSNAAIYSLGSKKLTGPELQLEFHRLLSKNIEDSSQELLASLTKDGALNFDKVSEILSEELVSRGMSENFQQAVSVNAGKFTLPLSTTNMRTKFMSILSSLFTNRVTNQKMPGAHVVIASSTLLNYKVQSTDDLNNLNGIQFTSAVKERIAKEGFELKYHEVADGKITKVEALMPSWSADFFRQGQRINIDEIPEELRTMIGYRIPTEGKYSMLVFEVVGFLPESSGSTVILPPELVAQTGWDFDVDSLYIMRKEHRLVVNGKQAAEYITDELKIEPGLASKYVNEIKKRTGRLEVPTDVREAYDRFVEGNQEIQVVKSGEGNRAAINNQLFDIFESVLSNPFSYPEMVAGGNFDDAVALKKEVEQLTGISADKINPYTRRGQDFFRASNISGRKLKGFAANANSALAVLQTIKAYFREDLGFRAKYSKEGLDVADLIKRYGEQNVIVNENDVIVHHKNIAFNEDGTFTNINGEPITAQAAQILAMSVDIVKEGFPYNLNTYTFNTFMAMISTGIDIRTAGLYIRQPIINRVSRYVLNNESVLEDIRQKEINLVRKEYLAALYQLRYKMGDITEADAKADGLWDKKNNRLRTYGEMKTRVGKKANARLNLANDMTKSYTADEFAAMIKLESPTKRGNTPSEEVAKYYEEQLNILNQWARDLKIGQSFSDLIGTMVTDKLGAGPDLRITPNFIDRLAKARFYSDRELEGDQIQPRILVDNQPAVDAVYREEDSAYPVFNAYYEHSNEAAFNLLSPLFLETQPGYLSLKDLIIGSLKLSNVPEIDKAIDKFLFNYLTGKHFTAFNKEQEAVRVLGVNKTPQSYKALSIEQYAELSAAEKLKYVYENFALSQKGSWKGEFKDATTILRRLTPKLEEEVIGKRGMQSIEFNKPKQSDGIDDFLVASFDRLLNHTDPHFSLLAKDLIAYDYYVNGLQFNANSWGQYIPVSEYQNLNIGKDMERLMEELQAGQFNFDLVELAAKNNWNNSEIVPAVVTKYEYDGEGNRVKDFDTTVQEEFDVVDSTSFDWNAVASNAHIIAVPKAQMKNERGKVRNAAYIKAKNANGDSILLKRHFFGDDTDSIYKGNDNVYFYPINKLGSRYIGIETTERSMIESNNVPIAEERFINQIEGMRNIVDENTKTEMQLQGQIEC
jgi:hypothetical protein